ncbi:MAG: prephenate dehydratase [Prevotella sp.]|nr:prephenate dehydratase [Prevotella sp.]MBR4651307.1 prephenate dehydratase [Prevotella sp.]
MKRIAIQGEVGSFHDITAHHYFEGEQMQIICCTTFEEVFQHMKDDPTVIGIMAIENTIAGSLLHNYELLRQSGMTVVGEYKTHISHCICALPGQELADIHEVHSHPVALAQCQYYLSRHPQMKMVEDDDTAGAAMKIADQNLMGVAALCHADAARLYGLKVLEDHIEDNPHNFTRFLIMSDNRKADYLRALNETDKSSIVFSLPHEEGSLSQVLSILSFYKINLTKIQSLPIIGREWEYLFYVDVTYNDLIRYRQSIDAITPLTRDLTILGEYKAA